MAFQLKSQKKETANKTVRFPLDLIHRIEKAIINQDVTFSQFVIQVCEFALDQSQPSENNRQLSDDKLVKK